MVEATPISVSVSPFFMELLAENKLSPTEVFRVGMSVMLCSKGDLKFNNRLNRERLINAQKKLAELKKEEESLKFINQIDKTEKIYRNLKNIKKIINSIEKSKNEKS